MAASPVPHLANDVGAETIYVGVKEFVCIGARAPFDHPHVALDMGGDDQIICPYCSTLYAYRQGLAPMETDPANCVIISDRTTKQDAAA
ncbi:MAG: zinc-finger domain-containing protein [Pseudomonadota bacterium]